MADFFAMPAFKPMLAERADEPFDSPDFLFEVKWDGYRCLAYLSRGRVKLISRAGRDITDDFPGVSKDVAGLGADSAILDGELVAFGDTGPQFHLLKRRAVNAGYVVFDLLYLNGEILVNLPLADRRCALQELLMNAPGQRPMMSEAVAEKGKEFFRAIRESHLEGMMAKRIGSPYRPGRRSSDWLKIRCEKVIDCAVLGYGLDSRGQLASLALGLYDPGTRRFDYVGHVALPVFGTGEARKILGLFEELRSTAQPWAPEPDEARLISGRQTAFVPLPPVLICEVGYLEFTPRGVLRHAKLRRFREDKDAIECTRQQG